MPTLKHVAACPVSLIKPHAGRWPRARRLPCTPCPTHVPALASRRWELWLPQVVRCMPTAARTWLRLARSHWGARCHRWWLARCIGN